jgi:GT2 family glycosyltransferase
VEGLAALHGVVVTYRRPDALAFHLERLAEQSRRPETLVVVDNDPLQSARAVVERLGLPGARVDYLAAGENIGPAGGIALGMRHVLRNARDDDWLILLDDDDPPRTPELFAALERFGTELRSKDSKVGAVGMSGTRFDNARTQAVRVPDGKLTGAVPSACIGGNQLPMYSVHAVRAVGVFDDRLFFGFEELEYGLRLGDRGFGVYAHGELWHREREHLGRLNMETPPDRRLSPISWRRYYSLRNLLYIQRRRGQHLPALRLAARSVAKPLYNLPRTPGLAVRHLRLNVRAVLDAYRGRMGRTVQPVGKW